MGLIIGAYYRGDPRVKPAPWGNASQVQASIFTNAEREGYDPGSIAGYYPLWERAGTQCFNYGIVTRNGFFGTGTASPAWNRDNVVFSGNDFVSLGTAVSAAVNASSELTLFGLVSFANFSADQEIIARGADLDNGPELRYDVGDNSIQFIQYPQYAKFNNASPVLNQKYFCVGVSGNNETAVYVDGVKGNTTDAYNYATDSGEFRLGSSINTSGRRYLSGSIEQAGIITCALTPSQIAHLSDNPYFLLVRQPSVFYSVPSGAITLRQFGFRFYQDDAAPGSATALGDQDASVSLAPGSKFRIRMGIVKE